MRVLAQMNADSNNREQMKNLIAVSMESIDVQKDTAVVDKLENIYITFKKLVDDLKPIDSNFFLKKDRAVTEAMDALDKILFDRFGIHFKTVMNSYMNIAIYAVPPKGYNILVADNENIYENVRESIKYSGRSGRDPDKVYSEHDYFSIMASWKKSVDSLEKVLRADGVKVDLKNAKISGLPEDLRMFLTLDIVSVINTFKLTPREFAAVILHETGHAFDDIAYSYRTITNTTILLDTIQDMVGRKNKSLKEGLLISYKKIFDKEPTELKDKNTMSVCLSFVDTFFKESVGFNEAPHGATDSEQLADVFSARFGLGSELVTALDKVTKANDAAYYNSSWMVLDIIFYAYITILLTILITTLSPMLLFAICYIIAMVIGNFIVSVFTKGGMTTPKTYDDLKRRMERVRNDMIRQTRMIDLDQDAIKAFIAQLDTVDKIIKNVPEETDGVFDSFIKKYTAAGRKLVEMKTIEQLTEDLMSNQLYVASLKLKTIKG